MSKGLYRGQPVEDMSKESLEDALIVMSDLYIKLLNQRETERKFLSE